MKKAAILGISIFYLLFTTGMFVCAGQCMATQTVKKTAMNMPEGKCCCCKQNKNANNCCKHRDGYTLKEHVKPGQDFSFKGLTHSAFNLALPVFEFNSGTITTTAIRVVNNAPPWQNSPPKYVKFCSLLI